MISAAIEFFNLLVNGPTMIILGVASGLTVVSGAYFRSRAVDGKLTGEDWIFVMVVFIFAAILGFGIWKGVA